jgi:hypothetical protein
MTTARTIDEIEFALSCQLLAIVASGGAYDAGEEWEAYRISTAAYTMLHDDVRPNSRGRAILSQIGVKRTILYAASAEPYVANVIPSSLVMLDTQNAGFVPLCWSKFREINRWLPFDDWWSTEVVFADQPFAEVGTGQSLTRKDLILSMRSQDGGSHFDTDWRNEAYRLMAQGTPTGLTVARATGYEGPLSGAHLAAVRQIGWELVVTFSMQP